MKIITIVGARPQFIKAAVVSRAIKNHNPVNGNDSDRIKEIIVHTGQHYDHNMSDIFFEEMQIPDPNYSLNINGLTHGAMTGQMLEKIEAVLVDEKPDVVLVYGDTNTTLAGALAAVKLHVPVAHVEAGLRSFNRKMPEEINRLLTDHVSSFLFCPTRQAVKNLKKEGIRLESASEHKRIHSSAQLRGGNPSPNTKNSSAYELTNSRAKNTNDLSPVVALVGDVMLDATIFYKKYARNPFRDIPERFILSTIHRAENADSAERLQSIFIGLEKISQEIPIILPLHPRTRKKIKALDLKISNSKIRIVEPVSYLEMIHLLGKCKLVMTDSGGLQKEAFFFKKPCITLRDETEWVELVENGFNFLVGSVAENMYNAYKNMIEANLDFNIELYGDGKAGDRIVDILRFQ